MLKAGKTELLKVIWFRSNLELEIWKPILILLCWKLRILVISEWRGPPVCLLQLQLVVAAPPFSSQQCCENQRCLRDSLPRLLSCEPCQR